MRRILGTSRGSQFTLPEFIHHPWMNKSSSKSLARHIQEAKPMVILCEVLQEISVAKLWTWNSMNPGPKLSNDNEGLSL